MKDISEEVVGAIKEAIKLEIAGRGHFNRAVETTENELGKKMFRQLAQDEIGHLTAFKQLISSILGGEDWRKHVDEDELKFESTLIDELTLKVEEEERKGELGPIRIGMELERRAIDFFEGWAEKTDDPTAKEIFRKIADEEKTHYDLLQAQYDQVTNSGYWFDIAEFQMDGKY
jgi:rubrerythrin